MKKEMVHTDNAPAAIGPYSQAIKIGNMVYTSGQIPVIPKTGEIIDGGIETQTRQVLENIKAVLAEAGSDISNVIKTTVFIDNMDNFAAMNKVYGEYFKEPFPARSCVEVSKLPKGVSVEIETVAVIE